MKTLNRKTIKGLDILWERYRVGSLTPFNKLVWKTKINGKWYNWEEYLKLTGQKD